MNATGIGIVSCCHNRACSFGLWLDIKPVCPACRGVGLAEIASDAPSHQVHAWAGWSFNWLMRVMMRRFQECITSTCCSMKQSSDGDAPSKGALLCIIQQCSRRAAHTSTSRSAHLQSTKPDSGSLQISCRTLQCEFIVARQ